MFLTLLRHGIAAELFEMERAVDASAPTDAERPLTDRGRRRLKRAARGLRRLHVRPDCVLHSGLVRARETAELVVAGLRIEEPRWIETAALVSEADPIELFLLLPSLHVEQVLCVGHAPHLDRVLALACGTDGRLMSTLGKAGAACVELPDSGQSTGRLVWFLPPELLRQLGK